MPTYAFLTTDSSRVEATAKNAREAYKVALKNHKKIITKLKKLQSTRKHPEDWESAINGKVTKAYIKYDKDGFGDYNWRSLK